MNTRFYSEIENSFTSSRLSVYKQDGADNLTCLARYLYNIEVCKSLYSSLNIFEVTFRNAIDKVLCTVAGADNWYDILTLDSTSMKNINDAIEVLILEENETLEDVFGYCDIKNLNTNQLFEADWIDIDDTLKLIEE